LLGLTLIPYCCGTAFRVLLAKLDGPAVDSYEAAYVAGSGNEAQRPTTGSTNPRAVKAYHALPMHLFGYAATL